MPDINSVEGCEEYIQEVVVRLTELGKYCSGQGMHRQSAIFYGIAAMFCHSYEAVDQMVDAVTVQLQLLT